MPSASIVIGSYPHTAPLRSGAVAPRSLDLDFVDVAPVHKAFANMARHQRYDICEIAIGAFFQAAEAGKPLWLLPVVVMGGFHHGSIYYNPTTGPLTPGELEGKRVAVRSYSQTTGLWLRGVLAEEHGVGPDSITWVTTEGSHVAEYEDPPNVVRAEPGASLEDLLRHGRVDAAILGPGRETAPWCMPLIAGAQEAAQRWHERHGLVPINHMVCVASSIAAAPELTDDIVDALRRSFDAAATEAELGVGVTADRDRITTTLSYALDLARRQRLVTGDLDVTAMFAPASHSTAAR